MEKWREWSEKRNAFVFFEERILGDIVGKCGIEVGLIVAYRGIDVVRWLHITPKILFCRIVLTTLPR